MNLYFISVLLAFTSNFARVHVTFYLQLLELNADFSPVLISLHDSIFDGVILSSLKIS